MREPWSIVADHPSNGEPFGIIMQDGAYSPDAAEALARSLLATYRLLGTYIPTGKRFSTQGCYLFAYRPSPDGPLSLSHIWATCFNDAQLRLAILAEEGVLFMP